MAQSQPTLHHPSLVFLREFFRMESAGSIVLCCAAVTAVLMANSPLAPAYNRFFHETLITIQFGSFGVEQQSLAKMINYGLMTLFFLLVGLELKRERYEGILSSWKSCALPLAAALGGILVPAGLYLLTNLNHPAFRVGWPIPSATDIAFAVGAFALVGRGLPPFLRVFLLSIAILDDLGAILS